MFHILVSACPLYKQSRKDDVSTEKVLSNSNFVIPDNISNDINDLNNTYIAINEDGVSNIAVVDSPHKDVLCISEQLDNIERSIIRNV